VARATQVDDADYQLADLVAAELRISTTVNSVADALIRPEWWLLQAGVSLPIGGSLMVVARRPSSS
jgi:hypothetical protein